MEAWLSWLEHTVHIREVTGSSPVASTNAKTLLFSRVFLLPLVSATGSKVRSAPHTLCALCPSVTLHAPLSNASISAPLMGESCPSATRNLKDFSGCFLFSARLCLHKAWRETKDKISLCGNAIFSLFIRPISPFITRKIRSETKERQSKSLITQNC